MPYRDEQGALRRRIEELCAERAALAREIAPLDELRGRADELSQEIDGLCARASRRLPVLETGKPCDMRWEDLPGDERVRFCGHCKKKVYNLAELGIDEVAELVSEQRGVICARLVIRPDNTATEGSCGPARRGRLWLAGAMAGAVVATGAFASMLTSRQYLGAVSSRWRSPEVAGSDFDAELVNQDQEREVPAAPSASASATKPVSKPEMVPCQSPSVRRMSAWSFDVDRCFLAGLIAELEGAAPVSGERGRRIAGVRPGSRLAELGVANGDVLVTTNWSPLPEHASAFGLRPWRDADTFTLAFLRGGKPIWLECNVRAK